MPIQHPAMAARRHVRWRQRHLFVPVQRILQLVYLVGSPDQWCHVMRAAEQPVPAPPLLLPVLPQPAALPVPQRVSQPLPGSITNSSGSVPTVAVDASGRWIPANGYVYNIGFGIVYTFTNGQWVITVQGRPLAPNSAIPPTPLGWATTAPGIIPTINVPPPTPPTTMPTSTPTPPQPPAFGAPAIPTPLTPVFGAPATPTPLTQVPNLPAPREGAPRQ